MSTRTRIALLSSDVLGPQPSALSALMPVSHANRLPGLDLHLTAHYFGEGRVSLMGLHPVAVQQDPGVRAAGG